MYIQRTIHPTFIKAAQTFPAVLITGPRQSGKTTFLKNVLQGQSRYVTFDDPLQRDFAKSDPRGFISQFSDDEAVILDEIQYMPELFSYLKMDIDSNRERHGRWIMTGSQQFQLMQNISDSLAGRIAILNLLPFSLHEAGIGEKSIGRIIFDGGYPPIIADNADRQLWLSGYFQTYVERDIRQLARIHNLSVFETFVQLMAASHGQEANLAAVSRKAGISQPTCREWQSLLQASFIIQLLQPFSTDFGKRLVKSPKLYFLDSALAAYLTRQPSPDALWAGNMGGAFFEGLVVCEAVKAFASRGMQPELYYWRSHDGLEVDLLVRSNGVVYPVEIKQTASPTSRHAQALVRLKSVFSTQETAPGIVVCTVGAEQHLPNGVKALPWQQFPEWIDGIL
jgi:uncharacterized protein